MYKVQGDKYIVLFSSEIKTNEFSIYTEVFTYVCMYEENVKLLYDNNEKFLDKESNSFYKLKFFFYFYFDCLHFHLYTRMNICI